MSFDTMINVFIAVLKFKLIVLFEKLIKGIGLDENLWQRKYILQRIIIFDAMNIAQFRLGYIEDGLKLGCLSSH